MGENLGKSRLDLGLNKPAARPARSQATGLRIALISGAALLLGITGLIAHAVSSDGNSPLAGLFDRSALANFGGAVREASSQATSRHATASWDDGQHEGALADPDIAYGPPILQRRVEMAAEMAKKDAAAHMSKDRWRGAKTESAPKEDRRYAEKTAAPEKGFAKDRYDYAPKSERPANNEAKKDGYYTPSKDEKAKSPPAEKELRDEESSRKFDETPKSKESPVNIQEPIETNRKIIRTGEMDFEIDSYDVAIVNITRLIIGVKGAFISDSKSGQLKNGKLHGYVVVRMPPQYLDTFILDLRRDLGRTGELKTQRINSQDVTKQYTDIESGLKAARTMEERFLQIIKTGKGEIKDLIAAENALGEWRTKIEKMEGEMRYYANQISLSTLTISLSERELQTPFALVATENVTMRIEVEDVKRAHATAEKAVLDAKGRVLRSEVKQHAAGQLEAILHAEMPPAAKDAFSTQLEKLGIVSHQESHRQQQAIGGAGKLTESIKPKEKDARFDVTFNNLVNVAPRHSTTLQVASLDVAAGYQKLHDAITRVKGQVRTTYLNETDKNNISASIEFTILAADKQAIDKAIADVGPLLSRNNVQAQITELATERKFGYNLTLVNVANTQPREKTQLKLESKNVDEDAKLLKKLATDAKGRVTDARTQRRPNGEVAAILAFDVPLSAKDALVRQFKDTGKLLGQEEERFPTAPDNELAIARIHVILAGESPIVPSDEGFGASVRYSLYLSFKIFVSCIMFIIIGASVLVPWGLLIWGGYKLYCRVAGPPVSSLAPAAVIVQPVAENEKPAT